MVMVLAEASESLRNAKIVTGSNEQAATPMLESLRSLTNEWEAETGGGSAGKKPQGGGERKSNDVCSRETEGVIGRRCQAERRSKLGWATVDSEASYLIGYLG